MNISNQFEDMFEEMFEDIFEDAFEDAFEDTFEDGPQFENHLLHTTNTILFFISKSHSIIEAKLKMETMNASSYWLDNKIP